MDGKEYLAMFFELIRNGYTSSEAKEIIEEAVKENKNESH